MIVIHGIRIVNLPVDYSYRSTLPTFTKLTGIKFGNRRKKHIPYNKHVIKLIIGHLQSVTGTFLCGSVLSRQCQFFAHGNQIFVNVSA